MSGDSLYINIPNINFPDKQSQERLDGAWDLNLGKLQPKSDALSIGPGRPFYRQGHQALFKEDEMTLVVAHTNSCNDK
jgi:hypothetical protein